MVIVLATGFPLLAWAGVLLKRRHERKQDLITGGFNAGITERSAPVGKGGDQEKSISTITVTPAAAMESSGRNSPVRTREAFMPYGYGYAKSESRLGSSQGVDRGRPTSPLVNGQSMTQEDRGLGPWVAEGSSSRARRG